MNHALRLRWIATAQADLRILESDLSRESNPAAQYHAHAALKHLGLLYASLTILDDTDEHTNPQTPSAISSAPPPRMGPGESGRIEVES
jgi:hypothetical protein